MIYSFPGGIFGFANLKVSEIVVLKSTQKGLPAPDSDVSYNCGFSKGKWPSASHHDGAAFTLPSMCTKSHANLELESEPGKGTTIKIVF